MKFPVGHPNHPAVRHADFKFDLDALRAEAIKEDKAFDEAHKPKPKYKKRPAAPKKTRKHGKVR